jgi:hypothetical protein
LPPSPARVPAVLGRCSWPVDVRAAYSPRPARAGATTAAPTAGRRAPSGDNRATSRAPFRRTALDSPSSPPDRARPLDTSPRNSRVMALWRGSRKTCGEAVNFESGGSWGCPELVERLRHHNLLVVMAPTPTLLSALEHTFACHASHRDRAETRAEFAFPPGCRAASSPGVDPPPPPKTPADPAAAAVSQSRRQHHPRPPQVGSPRPSAIPGRRATGPGPGVTVARA